MLVAVTVNVYDDAGLNPVTRIGDDDPVAVIPPGVDVTVYPVTAAPLFTDGSVNATVAVVAPVFVAVPIVGAPGAAASVVMLLLAAELIPAPCEFVAKTINV